MREVFIRNFNELEALAQPVEQACDDAWGDCLKHLEDEVVSFIDLSQEQVYMIAVLRKEVG